MPVVTNIEDLRVMAKKRVARAIFDYVDRGSYDESTLTANKADLDALKFRQRVAIDVDHRTTQSSMLGQAVAMPVAIAPTGLTGLNWADGEILGARAAEAGCCEHGHERELEQAKVGAHRVAPVQL